jgi:type III restriction enzyme
LVFTFNPDDYPYPPNSLFEGKHRFHKHYYKVVGDMKASGEEYECAQLLNSHPKIKRWVRNLEGRRDHSFWLQTSSDRFYPDFVCELVDGRFLVVEYKGFDRWSDDDSREKRAIGQVWEEKSEGQCLFVMPKGPDWNAILAKLG